MQKISIAILFLVLVCFISTSYAFSCKSLCSELDLKDCNDVCSCVVDDGDSCSQCCDNNDCEDTCSIITDIGTGGSPNCKSLCNAFEEYYGVDENDCKDTCNCVFDDKKSCDNCCNGDNDCMSYCNAVCDIYGCDSNSSKQSSSSASILLPLFSFALLLAGAML